MIYMQFSSWVPKNILTRSKMSDITILVGPFCPHNMGFTRTTHTADKKKQKFSKMKKQNKLKMSLQEKK